MRNMSLPIALALGVCLGVAGSAGAGWDEGVAAFKRGNYSQAAVEFQAVVEAQPEWPGGHYMLGQVLGKLKRHEEALSHLRKAYDLEPNQVAYKLALARGYLDNRRYSESAQLLGTVEPSSLPEAQRGAYFQMAAAAFEKSGQAERAVSVWAQAARSQPGDADVQYRYGLAAFNAGQTDAAVAALQKAVRLDPGDAAKKQAYVKVLIRKARESRGDTKTQVYQQAVPVAAELVAASAGYENLLTLGEVQLGARQYAAAAETLEKAIAKGGDDWLPHFYRGQALTSLERYAEAESALSAALTRSSRTADQRRIWRQIGFINEKLKNYPEAKEAYRKAGDITSVRRVEENERIAAENAAIEEENRRIRQLEEERKRLEEELQELSGGGPPPLR